MRSKQTGPGKDTHACPTPLGETSFLKGRQDEDRSSETARLGSASPWALQLTGRRGTSACHRLPETRVLQPACLYCITAASVVGILECVCVRVQMNTCVKVERILGVFLYLNLPYFLRQGLSLSWKLTISARLAQDSPRIHLSPAPNANAGVTGTCSHASLSCRHWQFELRSPCFHSKHLYPPSPLPRRSIPTFQVVTSL